MSRKYFHSRSYKYTHGGVFVGTTNCCRYSKWACGHSMQLCKHIIYRRHNLSAVPRPGPGQQHSPVPIQRDGCRYHSAYSGMSVVVPNACSSLTSQCHVAVAYGDRQCCRGEHPASSWVSAPLFRDSLLQRHFAAAQLRHVYLPVSSV